jgi:uncharacterized Zn ribbon protein
MIEDLKRQKRTRLAASDVNSAIANWRRCGLIKDLKVKGSSLVYQLEY